MEKEAAKRSRPSNLKGPRKRQRIDHPRRKIVPGKVVPVSSLQWQPVKLPDQFEDAQGFFGLEEVDDVEIVREGNEVQYRVAGSVSIESQTGSESEWQGFEDEAPATKSTITKATAETERKLEKHRDKAKKDKTPATRLVNKLQNGDNIVANGFAALQESDDEGADVSAWQGLGLSAYTLTALAKLNFSKPTPVQVATIPDILAGEDIIGKASTGSGKTLAFALPIIESILAAQTSSESAENRDPTALILSPTRELAHQISKHIIDVCSNLTIDSPRVATLTGGLAIQKQERLLAKADIIIGTPGRLWEVMSTVPGSLKRLKKVKFLVADEADRLLSEGHFKEVEEILTALDRQEIDGDQSDEDDAPSSQLRQTLVFSATFQKDLQQKLIRRKVSNNMLDNKESLDYLMQKLNFRSEPKFVDVNPIKQMASNLREGLLECGAMEKDLYLYTLLLQYPKARTLVFTNSISSVRRLTPLLQNLNLKAFALHSEMPQKARLRSVERFADPATTGSTLIATDVAARGLDIPSVDLIIHYHVPRAADAYVHRSGRTARASSSGTSIMLCAPEETIPVQRLVSKIHTTPDQTSKTPSLRTLSLDRTLVTRLKPRITLSSSLVSATSSKAKTSSEETWLRQAAEDLGVDYDSADFTEAETTAKGRGRGKQRKKATREEAAGTSKEQLAAWRAELKDLLSKRVNVGVSEKYLSGGGVDVDALLEERENEKAKGQRGGMFLGSVDAVRGWD